MSTKLVELKKRFVTSSGKVVLGYDTLVKMARNGEDIHQYIAEPDEWTETYNRFSKHPLRIWSDNDPDELPEIIWNTPYPFSEINVDTYCVERLVCLGLDNNIEYVNRLIDELEQIEQRHMQSVIKHVIFLVDDFMNREVVFGVGRGSSCSSLVMFLIGINQVDPVKYNIDMEEFFKPI